MPKWPEKIKNLTKGLYLNSEWSKLIQYFPNSLSSPGKSEIVFVMGAGKQSSTNEIMIVPGHLGA